jgi:hypothetical protein
MLISDVNTELSIHVDAAAAQLLEQDSADAETIRYEKHKIFGKLNAVLETIELRDSPKSSVLPREYRSRTSEVIQAASDCVLVLGTGDNPVVIQHGI